MTHTPSAPTPASPEPPAVARSRRWTCFSLQGQRGTVLGDRFEVGELLGAGGTSWVYACRDRALRCMAAIKVLKDGSEDARRRFVDESRILANLRHPHLVQVLAVGETDEQAPFTVLELLPGRSLDERLRQEGPLPWREVVELMAQVAGALAVLHEAGVIHRDVKPNNVVQIGSASGRPLVKLIDLGIAKVHDWHRVQAGGFTPAPRHQTDAGLVVGTPGFYPPEAAFEPPGPRFDTFALGVTIYQLCTGEMPNLVEHRPMGEVRPGAGVPAELEALVATALAVLPEERIATADEFQCRLEAIRTAHAEESTPYLFDGCYELIEVLGAGAKAEVYRAYHRDAARYVALKLLSTRSAEDPEERLRFAREARVLSAVRHPALPELVECRTSAQRKQPYIAMSLVRGKRASEFFVGKSCLKPAEVIAVGKQLAGALAALHDRGILHRDVHASNVLIDLGREVTATLVDVGMADLEDRYYAVVEQRYPTPPEARVKLGTGGLEHLDWTAPEARAGKGWSAKSDVYSLGLLLYRLLTGKRPMTGDARGTIPPRQHVPACPRALSTALLNALAEDPNARVDMHGLLAKLEDAADELAEDACEDDEALQEEASIPATPPRAAPEVPMVVQRSRTWAWGAAAVALVFVALGLAWAYRRGGAPAAATPGEAAVVALDTAPPDRTPPASPAPPPAPTTATVATPPAPSLPTMRQALDAARDGLLRCSDLAEGLLLVEFTTAAERDEFVQVTVRGTIDEEVHRCVREATRSIRFEPTTPQLFTEEYTR